MSRLVVVSNRVAAPDRADGTQGGLAVALLSALRGYGGLWLGWDGRKTRAATGRPRIEVRDNVRFATLPLSRQDYNEYYRGYANSVLWPLFHVQLGAFAYDRAWEAGYRRVNRRFAAALERLVGPDDLIWVHDYHFMHLGQELRQAGVTRPIGFFLHTPFPSIDVLRFMPGYGDLLRSLLAYDLVGFQTDYDRRAFLNAVTESDASIKCTGGVLDTGWHKVQVGVFPIGVDVEEVVSMAARGRASKQNKQLVASMMGSRRLIIGADRLDYSKGLHERFRAFERLLERFGENRGNVEFLQIAAPSRTDVPQYAAIRRELDAIAGRINARYAEYDWTPLHYLNKGFVRATMMGFLSISSVGLVTPLRDGMNLVAKEFVAAQDPDDPGVLVLSRTAGAALELQEAIQVSPYDIDNVAEAIQAGLAMPLRERKRRWKAMMHVLRENDIENWFVSFLEALARIGAR